MFLLDTGKELILPWQSKDFKILKYIKAEKVQGDLRYEISDEREKLWPEEMSVSIGANFPAQDPNLDIAFTA